MVRQERKLPIYTCRGYGGRGASKTSMPSSPNKVYRKGHWTRNQDPTWSSQSPTIYVMVGKPFALI